MKRVFVFVAAFFLVVLPLFAVAGPISSVSDLKNSLEKIAGIIQWIFWVAAVVSAIYAAFLFLTAGGETTKVSKARNQLWYTVIAIVIALMSAGLPTLVENIIKP